MVPAVLGLAAALLVGCTAPERGAAGTPVLLYVANARDDTITILDSESGRPLGPPARAGRAPAQLAADAAGNVLHLSVSAANSGAITWLHRTGRSGGDGWEARPLRLGEPAHHAFLASDGAGTAAIAYRTTGPASTATRCRLALVDLATGTVTRTHTICGDGERISSLALSAGLGGVAYVGLWRGEYGPSGAWAGFGYRVVALDAERGTVLAVHPLTAPSSHLLLAPGPDAAGDRLYCFEPAEFADQERTVGGRGQLLMLDPRSLDVERAFGLPYTPSRVAVAPDGSAAYGLAFGTLRRTDLRSGAEATVAALPGPGMAMGLVVTGRSVYVANPKGSEVWVIDRARGVLTRSIPVGQHPVALALGPRG
jgi:YVTN family beta-propeller protein